MNLQLAQLYGTPGATQEDITKTAEATLFAKLAAENNIDLRALTDTQIQSLWGEVFNKTAEEEESEKEEEKDEEKEKKEAAAREHQQKLASVQEEERAHYLGQVMAHSYVAELGKIAAAQAGGEAAETDETKEAAMPPALAKALGKVRGAAGSAAGKAKDFGGKGVSKAKEHGGKAMEHVKSHKGAYGAGAAGGAGAGAGFAAGRHSKKEASVIDTMALEHAVKIAHADGRFDLDEVADRVGAIFTLGLDDSTKVASTADQQVEIRALEYLEAAGYPVEWAA